jgi:hypothetical protein
LILHPARYLAVAQWDRPDLEGSQFHTCQMDLLSWRQSINPALECTEENAFTRIEMGQLTSFFAREFEPELPFTTLPTSSLLQSTSASTGQWERSAESCSSSLLT